MTQLNWAIYSEAKGTYITEKVLSLNFGFGREKYLDNYSGNLLNLTINNASDYASGLTYGSFIRVEVIGSTLFKEYRQVFWVQEVNYDDSPGNTGLNTATIVCADFLSRAGRTQANALALPLASIATQFGYFNNATGGPLPAGMTLSSSPASNSLGAAITYTGTVANYINLGTVTERGYLTCFNNSLKLINRDRVATFTPITIELGRTTSTTQIAYQSFDRIQNGLQFINNATISSTGNTDQTASNATSVLTYGAAFYSNQTVDWQDQQANGNANWIVNNFSDPASLRFKCSFIDRAQDSTALETLFHEMFYNDGTNRILTLNYLPPGGVSTAVKVVLEGYSFNATPKQTTITFDMSPLQYYQFFTLDSSTLGILDTSRLGW